jgi:hypothetical protein
MRGSMPSVPVSTNMTSFSKSLRDINFATYGTFLEGLLSEDRKAAAIYRDAVHLLRVLQHGGIAFADR